MKIIKKIKINQPINMVWKIWAEEFDKAQDWMAVVVRSFEKKEGKKSDNSPMVGRVCEFSSKENGPKVVEDIFFYDKNNYRLDIKVIPKNVPIPLKYNLLKSSFKEISEQEVEMILDINPEISWKGYFLYPILKKGLSKSFNELLEEFKHYVETGKPHPRKLKTLKKL